MTDTVTIDRAEYEALLADREALEDMRAYDAAMTKSEEGIPAAIVTRVLDGESPVRAFREWRGLTQGELAVKAGVSRVTIAELEIGRKAGSVKTLKAVADALGLTIDDLT